jgi:P-type E1-E2 ATPase
MTLEKLSHIRQFFLDKTGTLTTGRSTLIEVVSEAEGVLQRAASLEQSSEHPLAASILAAAGVQGLALLPVDNFRARPGLGVSGRIEEQEIFAGSWRLVEQQGLTLSPRLQAERRRLEEAGLTVVHVGWQGRVQGLLGLAEELRPSAAPALAEMKRLGLTAQVLTGDSVAAGTALSQKLALPVQSGLLPHDKVALIEQAEARNPTAMVGDGLNDAPALARASTGLALGCGADVTREAADISLLGNDLTQVSWTVALARRVYRTIAWNLGWAFAYNLVGVGLAMAGLLHPVIAAAAMVISSALVVGNSLRILRF